MSENDRPNSAGAWSARLSLFAVGLVFAAGLFHRLFHMATPLALNLFLVAFIVAALAMCLGLLALVQIWLRGDRGTPSAIAGILVGAFVLSWPLSLMPTMRGLPLINDVTTDTDDPPPFLTLAARRRKGANTITYPGAAFAELQRAAYRDLQPLLLKRRPVEAFDIVGLALRRLGMETVNEVPVGSNGQNWGLIEAVDRTLVLGFYDDVVVRVRPVGGGTRIDVRSASRYGRHDLGHNAARIRSIMNEIVARADASVPGQGGRSRRRRPARSQ